MKYASGRKRATLFRRRRRAVLPLSLVAIGVVVFLFSLIDPSNTQIDITKGLQRFTPPPATATLTPLPAPTLAHGGQIVFTCTRGDYNQLCLIKPDGSGQALLTSEGAHHYYPVVSPSGDELVFASTRDGPFDLYRLSMLDGTLLRLTTNIGNVFSPDYSPDGQEILFLNPVNGGPSALWLVDRDGKDPRILYEGPHTILAAAWSPDGNTIAFAMAIDIGNEFEIYLLDLKNQITYPQQVSHGLLGIGGSIDWSPDGSNLLVYAGPPTDKDIFRIDVATGNYTQLTFGGNNASAAYSPDGQWIVFNSTRNDDQADLYIMRFDGELTRQLTDDPEPDWQPQWEP
ncbi:MAG TPA: hypothetical protein VGJ22_10545 [Anaerolineales bacterium]|jgi:TolB protein